MSVPKASVPRQIRERISENEKKLAEGNKGTPEPTPAPAAPAPASPEPPATPAPTTPTPTVPSSEPIPAPGVISPVAPEPPKPPQAATPEELLKRTSTALSTLQKNYNTLLKNFEELQQASQGNEALKAENDQLKSKISDLEKQITDLKTSKPIGDVTKVTVTEADKKRAEELGIEPEQVAAWRQEIVESVLAQIPKPPTEPKPATPSAPAKSAEPAPATPAAADQGHVAYLEMLNALGYGPEVRSTIVNDPKFAEFLGWIDGTTKRPLRTIAVEADAARDAVGMSEVYRAFLTWKNTAPAVTEPTKPSHLMPSSKGGPGDLNTNKKPIYTQAQVDEFQKKVKRGEYRTIGKSPEEAKKLVDEYKFYSDEFASARAEGRIRG